jgi:hypothetical protein
MKLLTTSNAKTIKGQKRGYQTYVMYLMPFSEYGSLCPKATNGCKEACLVTAGRNRMQTPKLAKLKRTELFFTNRNLFFSLLKVEIEKAIKQAKNKNLIPVFRLNGTSDISFENFKIKDCDNKTIFDYFSGVQFYDYTKNYLRFSNFQKPLPKNYHLSFSMGEVNDRKKMDNAINKLSNVKVYALKKDSTYQSLEEFYNINNIADGDIDDLRFLDSSKNVGLKAKGEAKKDTTGFVTFV